MPLLFGGGSASVAASGSLGPPPRENDCRPYKRGKEQASLHHHDHLAQLERETDPHESNDRPYGAEGDRADGQLVLQVDLHRNGLLTSE